MLWAWVFEKISRRFSVNLLLKIVLMVGASLTVLLVFSWIGLQVEPASFPVFAQAQGKLETIPLPGGLPAPVARFYRKLYGDNIPVIHSAVISGHAALRPVGLISLPARFRFTHVAGQDYRHYIEATVFGWPILKINESYIAGSSRMAMPWGTTENDPGANQGANLAIWAEAMWFPAILVTDPRVHWNAVDDVTATLSVPFGERTETFVARFDPQTNLLSYFESMRFKTDQKVLWLNEARVWGDLAGSTVLKSSAVIWMDDGKPWANFEVEEIVLNADVSKTIGGTGL
jgi:hypothetical protein